MSILRTVALAATVLMAAAACGTAGTAEASEDATAPNSSIGVASPLLDGPVEVLAGESPLGPILVGPNRMTLYGFTNDVDALSACYGTCADQWPPVIVSDDWIVDPALDAGIFATTVRDDGQLQLVAGRWPLYYYLGDEVPGDITGQGSGGVWFVAAADGSLILDGDEPSDDTETGTPTRTPMPSTPRILRRTPMVPATRPRPRPR